jgi:hypothetical protein
MCDILHLEGRKISKNKYGGSQPNKFENPCLSTYVFVPRLTFSQIATNYTLRQQFAQILLLSQCYKKIVTYLLV